VEGHLHISPLLASANSLKGKLALSWPLLGRESSAIMAKYGINELEWYDLRDLEGRLPKLRQDAWEIITYECL
jgi:hypothetical protein